jgi:hypothetical protein
MTIDEFFGKDDGGGLGYSFAQELEYKINIAQAVMASANERNDHGVAQSVRRDLNDYRVALAALYSAGRT